MSFSPFMWQDKPFVTGVIRDVTEQLREEYRFLGEARRGLCDFLRSARPTRIPESVLRGFQSKFDQTFALWYS